MEHFLSNLVKNKQAATKLIGLGVVVVQNNKIIGPYVSGLRKKGSDIPIKPNDKWHLGSVTKSITATMIARLIEQGILSWNTTIKDIFTQTDNLSKSWNNVTLKQLLLHTSGAPANFPILLSFKNPTEGVKRMLEREFAVKKVLIKNTKTKPGEVFCYSNVGYTIAAVMVEKLTGIPWEKLIEHEIFIPLTIKSGGFGPPSDTFTFLEQPRGHKSILGFKSPVSTNADNTPIIGPAGSIHMSLLDLAKYASDHLKGSSGKRGLLLADSYNNLHQPCLNNYACGWVVDSKRSLSSNKKMLWHNGSNSMWYSLVAIFPEDDTIIIVNANDGNISLIDDLAFQIVKAIINY